MSDRQDFDLTNYQSAFLVLHVLGGQIGLPVLVLTALLSKKVHMHPALLNFLTTWILYSFSYCMLTYFGQAHSPTQLPPPDFGICLAQAAMINGANPMAGTACLILVVQVWSTFHDPEALMSRRPRPWIRNFLIIAPPYLIYAAFVLAYLIMGSTHHALVDSAHGIYCTLSGDGVGMPGLAYVIPGFSLFLSLVIVGFEAAIIWNFVRRWMHLKKAFPLAERPRVDQSLAYRVFVFSLYSGATGAASIMFLRGVESAAPYLVQASVPLAAFATFATQREILFVWFPWERPAPEQPSGTLVVDRKMSSGTAALAFPQTPVSPAVHHVSWRDSTLSEVDTLAEEPGAMNEKKQDSLV